MNIYRLISLPKRLFTKISNVSLKSSLSYCGKNVSIGSNIVVQGCKNITINDGTAIGPNCVFYATMAELTIGKNVLISPNVTMITGEHRTDIIGEYMRNIGEDQKLPENDRPIVIEDDCWIGSNVVILKGTTIGRGSIIHAGAVVSGKIRPYTVYVSKEMKIPRFTDEEIVEHEKLLNEKYGVTYPPIKERRKGR